MLLDSSPIFFAVWRVLRRLIHPRYPPIALIQLDLKTSILFTFQRAKDNSVDQSGFEPLTPALQMQCSSQLKLLAQDRKT